MSHQSCKCWLNATEKGCQAARLPAYRKGQLTHTPSCLICCITSWVYWLMALLASFKPWRLVLTCAVHHISYTRARCSLPLWDIFQSCETKSKRVRPVPNMWDSFRAGHLVTTLDFMSTSGYCPQWTHSSRLVGKYSHLSCVVVPFIAAKELHPPPISYSLVAPPTLRSYQPPASTYLPSSRDRSPQSRAPLLLTSTQFWTYARRAPSSLRTAKEPVSFACFLITRYGR